MYAGFNQREIPPERMDEVVHTYLNSADPLRRQQGSIGAILLTDRNTGNVLNITLWKSESQMDADVPPAMSIAFQSGSMPAKLTRLALIFHNPSILR